VEGKIPFLGDLPLIGKLGRTKTEFQIRRRVVFAISPTLVNPDE
jgi:type II secretory pathway component GspD/PulD (secretin)